MVSAILVLILILAMVYFLGPKPPAPVLKNELPEIPSALGLVEKQISEREKSLPLKPDNEARFIWADDSVRAQTEYALLYLHGYSATWYEGFPVNSDFAEYFGCNAFFARLASHGIVTNDPLIDMTPDRLWESAKEALVIAGRIGKKVIIMSTSTGGTLALKLAAEYPEKIGGLILYSPNVKIYDRNAFIVSKPWGLQFARLVAGGKFRVSGGNPSAKESQYADYRQRLESVVYLQQLVESTMRKEVFKRVKAPVFLGYYYKNEEHQDKVVRVGAALAMFDQLATPADLKQKVAFPEAGDHVIACELYSKSVGDVRTATFAFARDVLKMKPATEQ